jgi:hypothetical protein
MKRLDLVTLLVVAVLAPGCGPSRRDGEAVERLGGVWVLAGETWSTRRLPVVSVTFDAGEHVLSDADLAGVYPSLRRMDPLRLGLRGSRVSDRSVPLINRLRSLREVDLRDTRVTQEGRARLRSGIKVTTDDGDFHT